MAQGPQHRVEDEVYMFDRVGLQVVSRSEGEVDPGSAEGLLHGL